MCVEHRLREEDHLELDPVNGNIEVALLTEKVRQNGHRYREAILSMGETKIAGGSNINT